MARLCEVCGIVEDDGVEAENKMSYAEINMNTHYLCENCIKDRQHPHY